MLYNSQHKEQDHPIVPLLKKSSQNVDRVSIHYLAEDVVLYQPFIEEGETFQKGKKAIISGSISVSLRKFPGGIKSSIAEKKEYLSYLGMNKEWVVENQQTSSHTSCSFSF